MYLDDTYSKALLHFNGENGSTKFTDESGKTWTANGNTQIDTAQSVFGGASGLFDGVGDYIETPDDASWDLFSTTTEDETIDFWAKINSGTNCVFFCQYQDANNFYQIDKLSASSTITFRLRVGGTDVISLSATNFFTDSNWHHVALVKKGGATAADYFIFKDGTQISTVNDNSTGNLTGVLRIGGGGGAAFLSLNGWIDEFRISKGVARWTASFVLPVGEYGRIVFQKASLVGV